LGSRTDRRAERRSESPFDIAALLSSPDEESRRTGLEELAQRETNRAIQTEFLGDLLDERFIGDGPYSPDTLLRPLAEVLARIAREPGLADLRADAVRLLAYSEAPGAADVLGTLADDADPQVRDCVAIGLTFLGQSDHLESLRSIVNRPPVEPRPVPQWRAVRLDEDPLIALAHQHSNAAIDILGAALVDDLKGLQLVNADTEKFHLEGRVDRASEICKLLGRAGNPRSVRWLTSADDFLATRPDLAQHFPRHEVAESMLRFPHQAKDRIFDALETGKEAADWVNALRATRDADFLPAVRTMLRRQDVNDHAK
jgi:HEAT repeats